ncbi:MAG: hypothetical protein LBF84_01085 [Holosporales bacterium]|jgi:hypothetical protein|nr:hypothetical protein [Holosporales bacterium]
MKSEKNKLQTSLKSALFFVGVYAVMQCDGMYGASSATRRPSGTRGNAPHSVAKSSKGRNSNSWNGDNVERKNQAERMREILEALQQMESGDNFYDGCQLFHELNSLLLITTRGILENAFNLNINEATIFNEIKTNLLALVGFKIQDDELLLPGLLSMYGWDIEKVDGLMQKAIETGNKYVVSFLWSFGIPLSDEIMDTLKKSPDAAHKDILGAYRKLQRAGLFGDAPSGRHTGGHVDGDAGRRITKNQRHDDDEYYDDEDDYGRTRARRHSEPGNRYHDDEDDYGRTRARRHSEPGNRYHDEDDDYGRTRARRHSEPSNKYHDEGDDYGRNSVRRHSEPGNRYHDEGDNYGRTSARRHSVGARKVNEDWGEKRYNSDNRRRNNNFNDDFDNGRRREIHDDRVTNITTGQKVLQEAIQEISNFVKYLSSVIDKLKR